MAKIMLVWADKGPEFKKFMEGLEKAGHKIVYWVGSQDAEKEKLPGTIFHEHLKAWLGQPSPEIDESLITPVGKEIIESFYHTESCVLTMMNKKFDNLCVDARKHLYYRMLTYWYRIIERLKPEAIIFPDTPHTVYNYIIYDIARYFGIKTLMFEDTWVSDRLILYEDFWKGSEKFFKNLELNRGKDFSIDDLSHDLKEHYLSHTRKNSDTTPIYLNFYKSEHAGLKKLNKTLKAATGSFKQGNFFPTLLNSFKKRFGPNIKKEYSRLEIKLDFSKKFIYMPLGFQPERMTSPQGSIFVDQILAIEFLSAALPKDWLIYVKEHPSQWLVRGGIQYSSVRYPGYYRKIASLKNVRLVPINTNTYELMNKSQAVSVITGTAGWEALLRSKPVLLFGYPWYRDCLEVFRVTNFEECCVAFKKIESGFKVNQQNIINFLKSFDESTFHGYIEKFVDKISKVSKEENMNNLAKIIVRELAE